MTTTDPGPCRRPSCETTAAFLLTFGRGDKAVHRRLCEPCADEAARVFGNKITLRRAL